MTIRLTKKTHGKMSEDALHLKTVVTLYIDNILEVHLRSKEIIFDKVLLASACPVLMYRRMKKQRKVLSSYDDAWHGVKTHLNTVDLNLKAVPRF